MDPYYVVQPDGGKEELTLRDDRKKEPFEEKGSSNFMLTWGPVVAYVVVAVLVALLFTLATINLLRKRKSRTLSRERASPPTQRATLTLRNGEKRVHLTEMSNIVLIANQMEETTKF